MTKLYATDSFSTAMRLKLSSFVCPMSCKSMLTGITAVPLMNDVRNGSTLTPVGQRGLQCCQAITQKMLSRLEIGMQSHLELERSTV